MNAADIKTIAEAHHELVALRARDGVPSGVSEQHWNSLIIRLDEIVLRHSGHKAWMHPLLYTDPLEAAK